MGPATIGAKTVVVEHETMTGLHLQMLNTPEVKVPRVNTNYNDLLLTTTASCGGGRQRIGIGGRRRIGGNDGEGRWCR